MISPSTPPGTKIVCIDVDPFVYVIETCRVTEFADMLTLGAEYTLEQIVPITYTRGPSPTRYRTPFYAAVLCETLNRDHRGEPSGWRLQRFRRRDLPESLTRLQTALRRPAPALG